MLSCFLLDILPTQIAFQRFMDISFKEYRFSPNQKVLYKQDQIVALKHTQTLLLDFFLSAPEDIHSKEAIMDAVWPDKDVSEQVVFQTISQLRAILGNDAIRTFSKKGYQWQIPLENEKTQVLENKSHNNDNPQTFKRNVFLFSFFTAVIVVLIVSLFSIEDKKHQLHLHLVGSEATANKLSASAVAFRLSSVESQDTHSQYFAAPQLFWQKSGLDENGWLLWIEESTTDKGVFARYGLANGKTFWQGYIFAETKNMIPQALTQRLNALSALGLFDEDQQLDGISALTKMAQLDDSDPDLLLKLANYYLEVRQLDVALTYAEKLATLKQSKEHAPYRAKAHALVAEVYKQRAKPELAAHRLALMKQELDQLPIASLLYDYYHSVAWLNRLKRDYDSAFAALEEGLQLAKARQDVLAQFELHITYSILAKKAGNNHQKYAQLTKAKALQMSHQLDESNLAVVYFHHVLFTDDPAVERVYLEKIQALQRTTRNGWVIDDATEMLVDQYLASGENERAVSLLKGQTKSSRHLFSLAKIYQATGKKELASQYFVKAFELARLEYNTHIASHAAVALYKQFANEPEVQAPYLDYLERNANQQWLAAELKE